MQDDGASDTSKYDLGLTSLANKCDKIKKAKMASFNRLFKSQNKDMVGFIPLSKLPPRLSDNSCPTNFTYFEIQKLLREDGRPNFCGLQLPVSSSLNHESFFIILEITGIGKSRFLSNLASLWTSKKIVKSKMKKSIIHQL